MTPKWQLFTAYFNAVKNNCIINLLFSRKRWQHLSGRVGRINIPFVQPLSSEAGG